MGQDLTSWKPSTALSIKQEAQRSTLALKYQTTPNEAFRQVKRLIASWPHARPTDPEGYVASLAAALAEYPLGVVQECCDPRTGLAQKREFPPTVACIVEWCDQRVKYHTGMVKWGKQRANPEPVFSDEHRKTMLERLRSLLRWNDKQEAAE